MGAKKKTLLIVPMYSLECCKGQLFLNKLQQQAETMTSTLAVLRADGYRKINLETLAQKTMLLNAGMNIDPSMFVFTGKKVLPDEKAFFDWYASTPEGRANKRAAEELAAGLFGHFAKVSAP